MDVDFNNLRLHAVIAYNSLVAELNRHVDGEELGPVKPHGERFTTGDIRDQLEDLRMVVATLIAIEDESQGIRPLDEKLAVFAPGDEERNR